MRKIIFLIIFLVSACDASEKEKIEFFADNIRHLVASEKRMAFKELPVFPGMKISGDAVVYVFGSGEEGDLGFVKFLSKDVLIKIYGPYVRNDADHQHSYSIVFYDPERISPNEIGNFNSIEIQKYWGMAFLETVVTVVDGKVMFHRTPFYFGSHAPWAEDY